LFTVLFYLTPEQQEERRENKFVPDRRVKKKLKKEELTKHLRELRVETGGTLKHLQELCKRAGRGNRKGCCKFYGKGGSWT
jgi:hypothetical protein